MCVVDQCMWCVWLISVCGVCVVGNVVCECMTWVCG